MPPNLIVQKYRGPGTGICWPRTGTDVDEDVGDIFGYRPFAAHASGYDFHRGVDFNWNRAGYTNYSPQNGSITRWHYTHFMFDDDGNMDQFTEVDPNSKATFSRVTSSLRIVGKNNGTVTFPSGLARMDTKTPLNPDTSNGDWYMDLQLASTVSLTGKIVYGMYDPTNDEYALLEYNGTTFTVKGKDKDGVMSVDGTTTSPSARTWMRIRYSQTSANIKWQHSTDGSTWTDIATEGTVSWTLNYPIFKAFVGWDPAGSGSDDTVDVDFFGWWDGDNIARFGNWVEVTDADRKFLMMHHRHLIVAKGAIVRAGDQIGLVGQTGFDVKSGRILTPHLHMEYIGSNKYDYSNAEPVNPLDPDLLPRTDVTNNVSVARSTGLDPLGVDSHILTISVAREDQDFDMNEISLTGNSATRTVNWNTRGGLDPTDNDTNYYNGVYEKPSAFDTSSATYDIVLYFNKSAVGSTFVSAYIKDTNGTTLWSE